jgi:hypothetical protein
MAKIKSTVDLIMEKTRHLSLNEDEKAALEKQQLSQRIRVALERYLKGERDANYLLREMDQLPADTAEEGKRLCLQLLVDRLHPFEDNQRILAAAGRLLGEAERERWERTVDPLQRHCREDLQKARENAARRCREDLAAAGLKGPAILPRLDEEDPTWKAKQEQRIKVFRESVNKALENPQL